MIKTQMPCRRHACELCTSVFECHLCEIDHTHPVHEVGLKDRYVYICLQCSISRDLVGIVTITSVAMESENIGRLYNYLTGKLIKTFKITGRKYNTAVWVSDF